MTIASCSLADSTICDASLRGMPSVLIAVSLVPASIDSNAPAGGDGSGTGLTRQLEEKDNRMAKMEKELAEKAMEIEKVLKEVEAERTQVQTRVQTQVQT